MTNDDSDSSLISAPCRDKGSLFIQYGSFDERSFSSSNGPEKDFGLDDTHQGSTITVAIFSLVATMIGGGVLTLPFAFHKAGIVLATLFMIVGAVVTDFSLRMLCVSSVRVNAQSICTLAGKTFGPIAEIFTTVLLISFLFFALVAYMILVRDVWTPVVNKIQTKFLHSVYISNISEANGNIVLLLILFLLIPFLLKKELHALRNNSYISFASMLILCIGLVERSIEKYTVSEFPVEKENDDIVMITTNFSDALFAITFIVLTFLCSFNILDIQNSLVNATEARMNKVIDTAIAITFGLTYIFGLSGYLYARGETKGNILLNFPLSDWFVSVGKIGLGLALCSSIPLITLPFRETIFELSENMSGKARTLVSHLSKTNGVRKEYSSIVLESQPFETVSIPSQPNIYHICVTFGVVGFSYLGAVFAPGIETVTNIFGSTIGFAISFILPAAFYMKTCEGSETWSNPLFKLALTSLIISSLLTLACTVQTVQKILFC